jgi:hypothetical protein
MIWSVIQLANSKSARKKKKQPTTPSVLLSCQLRMVIAQSAQTPLVFAPNKTQTQPDYPSASSHRRLP